VTIEIHSTLIVDSEINNKAALSVEVDIKIYARAKWNRKNMP
jgi:hypothetical protein